MPKPKQTQQETVSACPPSGRATSDAGAVPCGVCLMAVMRAGSVPTGAYNPGHRGSTPRPATSRRLDGIAGARPRTPGIFAARQGTGADSGDSRERPAQPMQRGASGTHGAPHRQAGSTPAPATNQATGRLRPEGSRKSLASALSPGEGCGAGPTRDASDASKSSVRRDGRERPAGPRQVRGRQRTSDAPPGGMPGNTISAPAGALLNPPLFSSLPPAGAVSQTAREGRR